MKEARRKRNKGAMKIKMKQERMKVIRESKKEERNENKEDARNDESKEG